jgi:hypothetical protein
VIKFKSLPFSNPTCHNTQAQSKGDRLVEVQPERNNAADLDITVNRVPVWADHKHFL